MSTQTYTVTGMTCGHCAASVTEEISELAGVEDGGVVSDVHPAATDHQHGYIHRKDDYLKRLRRIEGQARGLQRMVEDEKYCIDILTQDRKSVV